MFCQYSSIALSALLWLSTSSASSFGRGLPANATSVTTITSPGGATIRYKEPGRDGVCETTPGVNSYAGYVDLDANTHMFFWFFEARTSPADAPLTLWLNGGPGSDSMIGLFQEHGPCNVSESLTAQLNPYSWNEVSNMLYLSQPIGVGFSYAQEALEQNGRYAYYDAEAPVATTDQAAVASWHVLQAFLANLPQLDSEIKTKTFNLWTESYGGHYGPAFFSYFSDQNLAIANGTQNGTQLVMDTLGIGNGIIDETVQAPYFPEFAVNNTYGIKAVTDEVYLQMKAAYYDPGMCRDQVAACATANRSSDRGMEICVNATETCRGKVEGPYYNAMNRGTYDIRHPYIDPTPPTNFIQYLNQGNVQQAIGVNLNYSLSVESSVQVQNSFGLSGDFAFPQFTTDLETLLSNNVRVALYYGDADYICNWFGGQAVSLAVNYTHSTEFRAAGYVPFVVNGIEFGEVRQYGNFSFLRVYESGHEVPYYQPVAALEFFRRVLANKAVADGVSDVTGSYGSNGTAQATHTECYVPLPTGGQSVGVASCAVTTVTSSSPRVTEGATGTGSAVPTTSSSGAERRMRVLWR